MMPVAGRTADRVAAIIIYTGFSLLVLWAGMKLINYVLVTRFYEGYIVGWEIGLRQYNSKGGNWPHFSGGNHVEYMNSLVRLMQEKGTRPPLSNTGRRYVYHLKRLRSPGEYIFLLCFPDRIVLYGMSDKTFMRMDKLIDGESDCERGLFTGRPSKDGLTYTGVLRL
ncbi:MAG: hypothetical protein DRH10_03705 [Deltaproteobacteria bacterium]|nr:MAG: hypothetical protein DRH10_03705 [Deltaproteobacteria bacterium]